LASFLAALLKAFVQETFIPQTFIYPFSCQAS